MKHEPDKKLDKDLKTFDQQPAKTKELEHLQGLAEKATGEEREAVDKKIQAKTKFGE
ncbi:MAG: hypothetical protein V4662_11630 [Verrucomicrobiota bacterium]